MVQAFQEFPLRYQMSCGTLYSVLGLLVHLVTSQCKPTLSRQYRVRHLMNNAEEDGV